MIAGWTQQNTHSPTNRSGFISTLLSTLASRQCQLCPHRRGRVGHYPERVTESMSCKGEVMHASEGNGGKFGQYTEGGTVREAGKGNTTNQSTFTLTQVGYPQLTGGKQEAKYQNLKEPPGSSQVQIPVKIQLARQLYQSKRSIAKGLLTYK